MSVRGRRRGEEAVAGPEAGLEVDQLKQELDKLKAELSSTRQTILRMHEREDRVKQRYQSMNVT